MKPAFAQVLERHREEGEALIAKEAVKPETIRFIHSADMQFVGQTHILNVPLPSPDVTAQTLQALFEKAYFARFKVELPEIRANLVNLNTSVIGVRPAVDLSRLIDPAGRAATLDEARREIRPVWYRRELARHAGLCARKTAARRRDRRPGDPRADGRTTATGRCEPTATRRATSSRSRDGQPITAIDGECRRGRDDA